MRKVSLLYLGEVWGIEHKIKALLQRENVIPNTVLPKARKGIDEVAVSLVETE